MFYGRFTVLTAAVVKMLKAMVLDIYNLAHKTEKGQNNKAPSLRVFAAHHENMPI